MPSETFQERNSHGMHTLRAKIRVKPQRYSIKGENLRHDHVLITVNIFSIKRK